MEYNIARLVNLGEDERGHSLRIGVISDTHAYTLSEVPDPIRKALAEVDLIIHAGDFTTSILVLATFSPIFNPQDVVIKLGTTH